MPHPVETYPLFIPLHVLGGFSDRFILRDPGGRGRPGLRFQSHRSGGRFQVMGRFNLLHEYRVEREAGIQFADATGDDNAIHREGTVVPGAMTASKVMLPLEVLFPRLVLDAMDVKFRAVAHYGQRTRNVFSFRLDPDADAVSVDVHSYQAGQEIASARLKGRIVPTPPRTEVVRRKVNVAEVATVRTFLHAVGVRPARYFRRAGEVEYTYPLAYVTSLPSGAMVHQLQGQGGLLNKLSLQFEGRRIPITGNGLQVQVEQPRRLRRTFQRVVTNIKEGLNTVYKGTALVMSGGSKLLAAQGGESQPSQPKSS